MASSHGWTTGCQVKAPSLVAKYFVPRAFQMVACSASAARIPPRSSFSGEESNFQCAPASVVKRMAPARPMIQQTLSDVAEPLSRSTRTPLGWRIQECPPSGENSMRPARPGRQTKVEPGAAMRRESETITVSVAALTAYFDAASAAGAGGAAGGVAVLDFATFFA